MPDRATRNSLKPKHKLHWYVIERILGQGGFGITYLAHDSNLDRQVAIKEYLPTELAIRDGDDTVAPAGPNFTDKYRWGLERFITEARTLAKFKHPAIVRVLSVFEENNTAYMVMEYEQGESLQDILTRVRVMEEPQLKELLIPILAGLKAIHERGFIHRDIKPANIYVRENGSPVLLDFGSARQALGVATQTLTSVVSPGYAPFEQYYSKSDKQGPWTDIYGLGATLYRAISGRAPQTAIDRSDALLRAEQDIVVSARDLGVGRYSTEFLQAIDKALRFSEKQRPQSVDEWASQLGLTLTPEPVSGSGAAARRDAERTDFDASTDKLSTEQAFGPATAADDVIDAMDGLSPHDSRPLSLPSKPRSESRRSRSRRTSRRRRQTRSRWARARTWIVAGLAGVATVAGAAIALENFFPNLFADLALPFRSNSPGANHAPLQPVPTLLTQARAALDAGQLMHAQTGAVALLRSARRQEPRNPQVKTALDDLVHSLLLAAGTAAGDKNFELASLLLTTAEEFKPESGDVSFARQQLTEREQSAALERDQQQQITALLGRAAQARVAGQVGSPPGDNALEYYQQVLQLDRKNQAAEEGIRSLAALYARAAEAALQGNDLATAETQLALGSQIDASVPELLAAQGHYDERLATIRKHAQTAERIDALLAQANADLGALRLNSPPKNNALYRFNEVLRLDPKNTRAKQGRQAVSDRYVALFQQAMAGGDLNKAQTYLDGAAHISPKADNVRLAAEQITLRRQEQQRQAQLADEQQRQQQAQREAEQQALQRERDRERQQREAQEKRQRQEQEARRLLAEAEKQASERKRLETQLTYGTPELAPAAPITKRRAWVTFSGIGNQYYKDGLSEIELRGALESRLRAANFEVVGSQLLLRSAPRGSIVKVSLTTHYTPATGSYTYTLGLKVNETFSVNNSNRRSSIEVWSESQNGLVKSGNFRRLKGAYIGLVDRFINQSK